MFETHVSSLLFWAEESSVRCLESPSRFKMKRPTGQSWPKYTDMRSAAKTQRFSRNGILRFCKSASSTVAGGNNKTAGFIRLGADHCAPANAYLSFLAKFPPGATRWSPFRVVVAFQPLLHNKSDGFKQRPHASSSLLSRCFSGHFLLPQGNSANGRNLRATRSCIG